MQMNVMQRWMLNLIGVALLATPLLLMQIGVGQVTVMSGGPSSTVGKPDWLSFSISAGGYLLNWSPALLGALIIFYANWRRS